MRACVRVRACERASVRVCAQELPFFFFPALNNGTSNIPVV